ncbi:MAG: MFS transporter [Firmicutes bacterium]|nr:MFS transporter [Bacillota bacterium]
MKRSRPIFLFFMINILFCMAANFAHPVTPTLIQQRNFGDYMFGVALASMMTANFLFSPFWGKLAGWVSSRKVMLICAWGYAIGQIMFGFAATERMLVLARMFAGIFTGGIFTAFLTYLVNTSPLEERGQNLTVAATIQTVASAFGYFVGGMLGEIGTSIAIGAQVVLLAACGILFYLVCADDAKDELEANNLKTLVKEANPFAAFLAGKQILTTALATILLVTALANLGNSGFDQSFNYYLKAQLGLSPGYNGTIKAFIGLICLAANATVGMWLINKTDIRRSSIYVYLLCTLAMLGVVLVDAAVPFILANVVYFGFFAISVPLAQSLVADNAQAKDSNLVMGYYNGLKSLGSIFGSLAAGLLYTLNPKLPFVLGLIAFAFATLAAAHYYRLSTLRSPAVDSLEQ